MVVIVVLLLSLVLLWIASGDNAVGREVLRRDVPNKGKCSLGEIATRQAFESIYGRPFPKIRPDFLRNPETGRNLELDGYCSELKIAFEYNGKQHYVYPNFFHKTKEEFLAQVRRDEFKKRRCKEVGIHLIVVPYIVKNNDIRKFVLSRRA